MTVRIHSPGTIVNTQVGTCDAINDPSRSTFLSDSGSDPSVQLIDVSPYGSSTSKLGNSTILGELFAVKTVTQFDDVLAIHEHLNALFHVVCLNETNEQIVHRCIHGRNQATADNRALFRAKSCEVQNEWRTITITLRCSDGEIHVDCSRQLSETEWLG